jgi:chromosomal replication initiation ATPase DnaA
MQGIDEAAIGEAAGQARSQTGIAQAVVACAYDVTLDDMRALTRRGPRVALARQVAMYLSHIVLRLGPSAVAVAFLRHRSTTCHALHHIEDLREDPEFDRMLRYLESTLRSAIGEPA